MRAAAAVVQGLQMICGVTLVLALVSGQQMVVPPLQRPQLHELVQVSSPSPQRPQSIESPGAQTPWPVQAAGSLGHWQLLAQVTVPQLPQLPG